MWVVSSDADVFISAGGRDFDRSQPVLLFIHGSGQSHLSWLLQARFFANRGWSVLSPDLRGHYLSGGTPLDSITEMADWYGALLDDLGVASAVVIGHSQGGLTALELARRHSAKVAGLAIVASAAAIGVNQALLDLARDDEDRAFSSMVSWGHGTVGHSHSHSFPGQSHLIYGNRLMAQNSGGTLLADLTACANYRDGEVAAAAVSCPSLLILAEKDRMVPARQGHALAALIAGSTTHVVAGAGHFVHTEKPFETNQHLRNFFSS